MKKQILLPVLLAVFAVGSAFASINFAPGYYNTTDSTCSGTVITPPCTVGSNLACTNVSGQPYFTKADSSEPTSEENPCEILRKP